MSIHEAVLPCIYVFPIVSSIKCKFNVIRLSFQRSVISRTFYRNTTSSAGTNPGASVCQKRHPLTAKIKEDDDDSDTPNDGTVEKTVSTPNPDCGMFVKGGEHERQFAYEAHTVCDRHGIILVVEVTAGNIHDSVAWDAVYRGIISKYMVQFIAMDAGYKTPRISKKTIDDGKVPILPYTRYKGNKE